MHGVPDQGNTEIYTMQGSNLNPHLATPVFEHTETMNGEGIPEYVIDPALYYPTASNYGYYCTGYETPNEWDDHQRVFGLDSGDIPYVGAQTENLSYAYYTPAYGFGEYNPYNPYIPGAMVGVDGQYVGSQPYYSVSPYQNPVSSSAYIPVAGPPRPDAANSSLDPLLDTVPSTINRVTYGGKHSQSSSSVTLAKNSSKIGPGQSLGKISDGGRINSGTNRRVAAFRGSSAGNHGTSSFGPQSGSDNGVHGAVLPQQNQMKMSLFLDSGLSDFGPNSNARAAGDGNWSKFYQRRALCDTSGVPDSLSEQNRGPRTNRSKNQLVVKAYTTKAGDPDSQGNIVISADNYNRNDFPVDYGKAKFFVIKSYSEDDVHKSIKYNVWSSTPNGNKKLSTGYEEAQQVAAGKSGGCPIFLFFSVNASGQFCGVAEMVGPVDFDKDMDFWQQDKWSGSFPVKWHFIKDVPNTNFRHIILENNEHKPVTNSRDTQEILYKPGIEMLKLFKNYVPKTSLLDDFMYYENRQRIMLEERSRFLSKGIARAFRPLVEVTAPELALKEATNETVISENQAVSGEAALAAVQNSASTTLDKSGDDISSAVGVKKNELKPSGDDMVSTLKIGSLTINHKQSSHKSISAPTTKVGVGGPVEVVTVGSMPVKVNGHNNSRQSTGLLTVGSITIDPKSLRTETSGLSRKGGTLPLK